MNVIAISTDNDAYLTEGQAAEFLQVSVRTLQAWRQRGGGPEFARPGGGRAVRYRRGTLIAYMEENTVANTSAVAGREVA